MKNYTLVNRTGIKRFLALVSGMFLILMGTAGAQAQNTGTTPAGTAPGSPAGSYPLSGFETISPYSGNLNFSLPLLEVAGRGGMNIPVRLTVNQKWVVKQDPNSYGGTYYNYVEDSWWNDWFARDKGYSPGRLVGRHTGMAGGDCPNTNWSYYNPSITRLTFTTPDGTEHELVDEAHRGKPLDTGYCAAGPHGPSRGTVFVTTDGSSATFISDSTIYDNLWANEETRLYPSGYLMTKDGTRYRIDGGKITWIRDRNGNALSFTYESGGDFARITKITDSLKREVRFEYEVQDDAPYGLCDRIIYSGFGTVERIIRISYKSLSDVLRAGYSIRKGRQLFPDIYFMPSYPGGSIIHQVAESDHNPNKVSAVWLPDGVRSYRLRYNSHGELARVELPTGGAIEYDWADALPLGSGTVYGVSPSYPQENIYRRVIERRIYADGSALEAKMTVGATEWLSDTRGYVLQAEYGANGVLLSRVKHYYHGILHRDALPPIPDVSNAFYSSWRVGQEYQTDFYHRDGSTVLKRMGYTWNQTAPNWYTGPSYYAPPNNAHLDEIVTTLVDTNKVSKQTFAYDQFNNLTDTYDYDYENGGVMLLLRRTHTDYLTTNPVNNLDYTANNIHLRNLPKERWVSSDSAGNNRVARTTYEYDRYVNDPTTYPGRYLLKDRETISGLCTHFTSGNPDPTLNGICSNPTPTQYLTRGNATAVSRWLLQSNTAINSYAQYDIAGNVVKNIDARGHATEIFYEDNFGAPDGDVQPGARPAKLGTNDSFAFPTKVSNALGHIALTQYHYFLGKPVDTEDANGLRASISYDDPLDRPKQVVNARNTAAKIQTTYHYDDDWRTIRTTSDLNAFNDNLLKSELLYDGLGRSVETRIYEDATNYIATKQTPFILKADPDNSNVILRAMESSNPFRPLQGEQPAWMTSFHDSLGRVVKVMTPDSALVRTSYSGNETLVTDQDDNQRLSRTDALGRLEKVFEAPNETTKNYQTAYSYDPLGNLTTVTQGTTLPEKQTRDFVYDALSRLTSATNPESGTVTYGYDENGNLKLKLDARGTRTDYTYDALNRVTLKEYSDSTPDVRYFYDTQALPAGVQSFDRGFAVGRLVATLYGNESTAINGNYVGYTQAGRIVRSRQVTEGKAYDFPAYSYNLAGGLTSETYPSGRVVNHHFDNAGRLSAVSGRLPGKQTKAYAGSFAYTAHGVASSMQLGNGLFEHTSFNSRLQPVEIGLGTTSTGSERLKLEYSYGTTDNNGNIRSQTITVPTIGTVAGFTATQTYTYDALNRLWSATETSGTTQNWKQTFKYDRFGNRNFDYAAAGTTMPAEPQNQQDIKLYNPAVSASNNRLIGYEYDEAGNVITDAAGRIFSYDAENRQSTFNGGASVDGGASYYYDGDGRRVMKREGFSLAATVFVYNISGQLAAEYATSTPESNGTSYLTSDTLGTPRVITKSDGSVKSRHDYLPFGEEIFATTGNRTTGQNYGESLNPADKIRQKFTGQVRDVETGLDYFGARYYASQHGRFTSPDDFLHDTLVYQPSSWNLYIYVRNNPLRFIDPTGKEVDGTDLSPEQRQELIEDWKKKSGFKDIQFVNKNDRFILTINEKGGFAGGSALARKELLAAQASSFIFDLKSVDGTDGRDSVAFGESSLPKFDTSRGNRLIFDVRLDFGDFKELQGDQDVLDANSIGIVTLHEIEHSLHGMTADFGGPAPGPVEREYINPIRRELGLPERRFYSPDHYVKDNAKYEYLSYAAKDGKVKMLSWRADQVEKASK